MFKNIFIILYLLAAMFFCFASVGCLVFWGLGGIFYLGILEFLKLEFPKLEFLKLEFPKLEFLNIEFLILEFLAKF